MIFYQNFKSNQLSNSDCYKSIDQQLKKKVQQIFKRLNLKFKHPNQQRFFTTRQIMGNICSRLCPQRRKKAGASYDVHEETFEMQENIDSMHIDDNSPSIAKDLHLTDDIGHDRQSTESLISKSKHTDEEKSKKEQQKYIKTKIKSQGKKDEISEESVSFTIESQQPLTRKGIQDHSPFDQQHQNPSMSDSMKQISASKQLPVQSSPMQTEKPKQQEKKPNPNILKPKTIRKKYNPDDYQFKDETNQFRVKKIDSIKCQQYNIDNCNDSEYFIFDVTANVYIDNTNNCKIYIAPCESTIFVRNCKNLTIVAATKQFRTYECHNCVFSLICKSQPVIESSSELVFVPFEIDYYAEFSKQMNTVKLDLWNNHWSEIHNFTKKQGQVHHVLKRHLGEDERLNWQKGFAQGQIQPSQQGKVPFIQGEYPFQWQNHEKCITLFNTDASKDDEKIIQLTQNYRILKGFKGKLPGFGKEDRVALLLAYIGELQNKDQLQQLSQLFTIKQEVNKYQTQFFISFGDERQK